MELNVSQLLMEPSGSSREYEIDDPLSRADVDIWIRGVAELIRTNRSVWVSARLRSELDAECGRCLTPYSHPIRLRIEEEFVPTRSPHTGARVPPPDDDGDYWLIDENHILDLTDAVREYALMAEPMKPLCRRECAGLCATCGADLNRGRCGCEAPIDPRWASLKALTTSAQDAN